MTCSSEAAELFRMFVVTVVGLWPFARFVFIVWAVVSVTSSLSRIARNLERVVNRWDLEREADRSTAKPAAVNPPSFD